MEVVLAVLGIACAGLCALYIRMRREIKFLCVQLEEIGRGSHMEIAVNYPNKPLSALCRQMNRILASREAAHIRYEKAERQLKQDIAGLAHDIRTPLTGAAGYVQLAQECGEAERRERYLCAAGRRLTELGDMLEEMFLYTKLISEDFELSMAKIQVLPLLSECLLGLYSRFEEQGASPQVEFESEGFQILGDEEALRRIFLNLIQNALLHGAGGIAITQRGDSLIFENPLPEGSRPDPELLFDRFYKADSARRKGSSGLGLFIVRELTEKMGGEVRAEVSAGRLRVVVTVPPPQ